MPKPRGIRNNNPGNIRKSAIKWQGLRRTPFDPEFAEFTKPVYGLRALMKILLTYYRKYNLNSVQSIINRWAPPHENATDHYAGHVASRLKVKRTDPLVISDPKILIALAKAITRHENGQPPKSIPKDWYPEALYEEAIEITL